MLMLLPASVLRRCLLIGLLVLLSPIISQAQSDAKEPDSSAAVPRGPVFAVEGATIRLGALYQVDATAQDTDNPSGFDIRAARLRMAAKSHGVEAFLQTDFTKTTPLYDVRVRYTPIKQIRLTAGLFKSPFSRSHLWSRSGIPLVERPVAVDAIAPRRQVGFELQARDASERVSLRAGIFNGTGRTPRSNDDNNFLYVGRLKLKQDVARATFSLGANAAYSIDSDVNLGALSSSFSGTRAVFGADASITSGLWLFAIEGLAANVSPDGGLDRRATGGYVVAGAPLFSSSLQIVARYQRFYADIAGESDQEWIEAGLNYRPAAAVRFQLTGGVPYDKSPSPDDGPRATLRFQFALN
ncbi:hypothetical protein CRI94_03105 [Longibacter salinarum]|uniref:Porin n=1 Tax=Longibacter salinarum TaxID=1850348 RepID=A0A2A8D2T8_9BACT|nr:porin [Longibacter salinarum]PEN15282.1 hypothetical protein CRI94_03105 [Longibacter salinarum]